MDETLQSRVSLLLSSPGYGKTSLINRYLERNSLTAKRVRLSRSEPRTLRTIDSLRSTPANIYVVDDLEHLERDQKISDALQSVIEATPASRWILIGEAYGWLPVGKWMAHNICDLPTDVHDLALTTEQVRVLAAYYDRTLDDGEAQALITSTRGAVGKIVRSLTKPR